MTINKNNTQFTDGEHTYSANHYLISAANELWDYKRNSFTAHLHSSLAYSNLALGMYLKDILKELQHLNSDQNP